MHREVLVKGPKEVVLAYVDAFNRGDLETLCALFAPGALIWGVLGWGEVEVARPIWKELIEALQIQLTVESIVAEGGTVAVRYTERGKSVGTFRGQGPTNKSYELIAMEFFEVKNERIHRRWGARDSGTMNRQLGFAG
jgi:predicted ester cyclase